MSSIGKGKPKYVLTLKLISLVKERPALWDSQRKDHRDPILIPSLWEEVGNKLLVSGEDACRKFKNLRDTFVKEFRKVEDSLNSEDGDEYDPTWPYYRQLQFLTETVARRRTSRLSFIHMQEPNDLHIIPKTELIEQEGPINICENAEMSNVDESDESMSPLTALSNHSHLLRSKKRSNVESDDNCSSCTHKNKMKRADDDPTFNELMLQQLKAISDKLTPNRTSDEHENFAMALVPHLRRVPNHLLGQCHLHLLQIVVSYGAGIIPKKLVNVIDEEDS